MKLKCPSCGVAITAQDINIRDMVAVCAECDSVFTFKARAMSRQRKLKPPLHFAFKWHWKTEPQFAIVISAMLLAMGLSLLFSSLATGVPVEVLFIGLLIAAFPGYFGTTLMLNHTHFHVQNGQLKVYTEPLWFPYYGTTTMPVNEVTHITTEQSLAMRGASTKDTFYNVYAHTIDEHRYLIARHVNYDHAHFIAQELEEHLSYHNQAGDALFDLSIDVADDDADAVHENDPLSANDLDARQSGGRSNT